MTLIPCPLKPQRHLFTGRDSCHCMWEHLSHHMLRGDILSSSCCHDWVALGQLKAHFPQEEPAVILLPLPRGTFFSPTSLLSAADPGGRQDACSIPGEHWDPFLHPGQGRQEPWAGLPDPGKEQWLDLWSISKESSILLTCFKVMCALSSLPSLALLLDARVLF